MRRHPIRPRKYLRAGQERWRVHVPDDLASDQNARDRHFSRERDAVEFARMLTEARKSLVGDFIKLPQIEQSQMMRDWLAKKASNARTVAEAGRECFTEKKSAGIRRNSLVALKCSLDSMAEAFGEKQITMVVSGDIKAWLAAHPEWSPKSKLNNLKYASSLFNWCVKNQFITANPCGGVIRPVVPFKPVQILTVQSIRQLLKTCFTEDRALLGFLALVLFGGLRVAEARRCLSSNLTKGTIDLGGESCKLNERRCVKMSDQLCAWLGAWQSDGSLYGAVEVPNFANRFQALVKTSGVAMPKNALRHSFCSYSLELLGADATARAANNSPTMLFKHYAAMVSKEDAQAFAGILP